MKIFFDTEFIEDGKTIELISIGMVKENGEELYLESNEVDWSKASQWVLDNVKPHLIGNFRSVSKDIIADEIKLFVGDKPEFWAYFADYDWVVLCQLYGRMIDLPKGWPMFCLDLKQEMQLDGLERDEIPIENTQNHNALADAKWCRDVYRYMREV